MERDGKVYRNLEGQVAYLTQYLETNALANEMGIKVLGRVDTAADLPANDPEDPFVYGDAYMVGEEGHTPYRMYVWSRDAGAGDPGWFDIGYFPTAPDQFSLVLVDGEVVHEFNADTKMDIDTSTTTKAQLYAKNADGTQAMVNFADDVEENSAVRRGTDGNIYVPQTPGSNIAATSKKYVDDHFVSKQEGSTTYQQAYVKNADGTQGMIDILPSSVQTEGGIPRYGSGGVLTTRDPANSVDAVNLSYANGHYTGNRYIHNIEMQYVVGVDEYVFIKATYISNSSTALTDISSTIYRLMSVEYGQHGASIGSGNVCIVEKYPGGFAHDSFDDPTVKFLYREYVGGTWQSGTVETGVNGLTVTDTVSSF